VQSESLARRYVLGFCWKNYQRFCPKCSYRKFYKLSDGRRRCRRCRYTFHDFTQRWINQGNLSCSQWLQLVNLFISGKSTSEMASQFGASYNRTYKAVTALRLSIVAQPEDDESHTGEGLDVKDLLFKNDHQWAENDMTSGVPVFGIKEKQGRVSVRVLPSMRGELLLDLEVKKVRQGSLVYTDQFAGFDSLLFYGCRRLAAVCRVSSRGRVHINSTRGFWDYARAKFATFRGISPQKFPLYLKELEFRYNHRNQNLFPILVKYLCSFVPSL
jgi:transposase